MIRQKLFIALIVLSLSILLPSFSQKVQASDQRNFETTWINREYQAPICSIVYCDLLSKYFTLSNKSSIKYTQLNNLNIHTRKDVELYRQSREQLRDEGIAKSTSSPTPIVTPQPTILPTAKPTSTPTSVPTSQPTTVPTRVPTPLPTTLSTPTPQNPSSPTTQQYLDALNAYRAKNGKNNLSWSQGLADFAKTRTDTFARNGNLDNHAGFNDFIYNQNGFAKLGFRKLGENSSIGYSYSPTDLIEKAYAQSPGHNSNQLGSWSHIGISINGTFTDFVFGGN